MHIGYVEIITVLVVIVAFFVKGFSGFGPALILIPVWTILYDPETAIFASTYFDALAGLVLLFFVRKEIDWKFVIPVTLLIFIGAYFGAKLLKIVPADILVKIIGIGMLIFIPIIIIQNRNNDRPKISNWKTRLLSLPIALLAGFSGGMIGITGPLLVIFMKLNFDKDYFRNQLIAIFMFGAVWRFYLYRVNEIAFNLPWTLILFLTPVMLVALYLGHHFQKRFDEQNFNRVIALILLIPTLNLLLSY